MANKKISELQTRTPSLSDLILVGDPSNGFSYKCTVSALATIIETDIADGYVTLGTTQTISGGKTFSNNLTLTSVANASTDPDKFLVLNGSNVVNYRTGSEVLSDIGGQGTITLTTTGTSGAATFSANTLNIPQYQGVITLTTTGTSGAATLVGNTLNIPNYAPDLSGYVPTSRTITINGTTQDLTANRTYNVGTVTSVAASGGTGISISGSPITSSGTITITNTAPDQVVALTAGTGISISGTYPNFTITNSSPSLGGTVTSVALSAPTGFAVTGSPITSSGTLALAFASGYSLPTTASQTNWDSAYNNMIVSAAVTGTTTKTLTLTQQDAGTITASWTDDNTDAVTSVFGRTGAVVATEGDYSLTQLSDVTITTPSTGQVLKYNGTIWVNDTDANTGTVTSVALSAPTGFSVSGSPITSSGTLALSFASGYSLPTTASQANWDTAYTNRITSLTTTGSSGAATLISNTLNIPNYTLAGLGGISLTSLSAFVPLNYNNTTGQFSIDKATSTADGYLSATDWNTFNNKQATITLTTTGTSGAATFTSNTLNIPQYQGALTLTTTGTSGAATLVGNTLNIPQYSGGGGTVSGTTNYIAKFTSSTAVGDSRFFDNGTITFLGNGDVNAVPSTAILSGTGGSGTNIAGAEFRIRGGAGTGTGVGGPITFYTSAAGTTGSAVNAATERMRIDNAGNLGLGVTPSAWGVTAFQVNGTSLFQYGTNNSAMGSNIYFDGTLNRYIASSTASLYQQATGQHIWYNAASGTAGNAITFTQAMTLNASGNLGIGTTTIGSKLQVNGNAAIGYSASTAAPTNGLQVAGQTLLLDDLTLRQADANTTSYFASPRILIQNTSATVGNFANLSFVAANGDDAAAIWTILSAHTLGAATGQLVFGTTNAGASSTERMRINSTGSVFVGNGETSLTPATGIISGTGGTGTNVAGAEFRIRGGASTGSGAGGPITFYTSAAGSAGTGVNAATERMRIDAAGQMGLGVTPAAFALSGLNVLQVRNAGFSGYLNNAYVTANVYYDVSGNARHIANGFATEFVNQNGEFLFYGSTSGTAGNIISSSLRMSINSSGNIGIATNTIGSRLQVNGNAAIGYSASTAAPTNGLAVSGNVGMGTTTPGYTATSRQVVAINGGSAAGQGSILAFMQAGVNKGYVFSIVNDMEVWCESGTLTLGNNAAAPVILRPNNTDRLTVTSGGQVTLATGANVSAIAQTGYSLTGSNAQSLIDLAGTWNTTGNPTAIKLNITNTASGTGADLMELQVGGVNQFVVTKAGNISLGGSITTENPTGGTKKPWKLGSVVVTGSWVIDSSRYVEVEIDGTAYKLALAIAP